MAYDSKFGYILKLASDDDFEMPDSVRHLLDVPFGIEFKATFGPHDMNSLEKKCRCYLPPYTYTHDMTMYAIYKHVSAIMEAISPHCTLSGAMGDTKVTGSIDDGGEVTVMVY